MHEIPLGGIADVQPDCRIHPDELYEVGGTELSPLARLREERRKRKKEEKEEAEGEMEIEIEIKIEIKIEDGGALRVEGGTGDSTPGAPRKESRRGHGAQ
ncbi:MAG: hypothetical protein AB1428_01515 [Bacteroidota bacterium]